MAPISQKRVALTFDDLPAVCPRADMAGRSAVLSALTERVLRCGVVAVGFAIGEALQADEAANAIRGWAAAGFELGNHSHTHPRLQITPPSAYESDVLRADAALAALGASIRGRQFYRPPYLETGSDPTTKAWLARFLREHRLVMAPVTILLSDWVFARRYDDALDAGDAYLATRVADAFLRHAQECVAYYEFLSARILGYQPAQIILLHANRLVVAGIVELVAMLTRLDYEFISLEQALADPAYERKDDYFGPGGPSWLQRWGWRAGAAIAPFRPRV